MIRRAESQLPEICDVRKMSVSDMSGDISPAPDVHFSVCLVNHESEPEIGGWIVLWAALMADCQLLGARFRRLTIM